jgi:hypothetical protein
MYHLNPPIHYMYEIRIVLVGEVHLGNGEIFSKKVVSWLVFRIFMNKKKYFSWKDLGPNIVSEIIGHGSCFY